MWDLFNKLHKQILKEHLVHSFLAWTTDNFVFSWSFCLNNVGFLVPQNGTCPITPLVTKNSSFFGLRPQDLIGTSSSVRTWAMSCPLWHVCTAVMPPPPQVTWEQCRHSPGHSPGGSCLHSPAHLWEDSGGIMRTLGLWCKSDPQSRLCLILWDLLLYGCKWCFGSHCRSLHRGYRATEDALPLREMMVTQGCNSTVQCEEIAGYHELPTSHRYFFFWLPNDISDTGE